MTIETERLILRPFRISDAADVFEYLHDPEMNCFLDMRLASLEDAEAEMARRLDDGLYLAVELKENGKVIGEIFSAPEGTDPSGEDLDTYSPCWMLHPAYKRKGYGYEMAQAYLDLLFRTMGARRVYMYTEDTNIASQKLCEKLGARREGLFLEFVSFVKDANGEPVYENTIQYAILHREWERHEEGERS
ncbi:MAG: GNAT family N-acetyltransferase [Oscillospiraceae bacterium]|nr:GNAT family N-acetyltransferase [Oscillospiraceae bacterium]